MLQPVEEGNYDALVNVMAYLMNVKERQEVTDEMFEPLKETIQLLKYYDQDLSEEVNVLLQVCTLRGRLQKSFQRISSSRSPFAHLSIYFRNCQSNGIIRKKLQSTSNNL